MRPGRMRELVGVSMGEMFNMGFNNIRCVKCHYLTQISNTAVPI